MRGATAARVTVAAAAGAATAYVSVRPTLVPWPGKVRPAVAGSLIGLGTASAWLVSGGLGLRAGGAPSMSSRLRRGASVAVASTAVTMAVRVARARVSERLAVGGATLDAGYAQPPTSDNVSGGPGSVVPYASLGREGARFVSGGVAPEVVQRVTGVAPTMTGIRVFVGYDSAASPEERVELAIRELHRTHAFDRSHLLIGSPAGSGYANSTPVDVLEILTGGDCAAVAVGYGLLPSFLSLNRVELAGRTQHLLLERIREELSARTSRPRVLLYGESLGARVQQAGMAGTHDQPADFEVGPHGGLDRLGVDAALWVGTPGGPDSVAFHEAVRDISLTIDRPEQIPQRLTDPRPRVWFLEHDGDPVVRFEPTLLYRRPAWLAARPRGRNVPEEMVWAPAITWAQVGVDTLFATNVKPGLFESRGHDYRADLGATVTAAYSLPCDADVAERLEAALRELEIARATRIGEG